MIEPITTFPTRSGQALSPRDAAGTPEFAEVFAARSDNRLAGKAPRRDPNHPATLGRDVNLAALAAHELTTAGTPRAEVAAAREEAHSSGEQPVPSEGASEGRTPLAPGGRRPASSRSSPTPGAGPTESGDHAASPESSGPATTRSSAAPQSGDASSAAEVSLREATSPGTSGGTLGVAPSVTSGAPAQSPSSPGQPGAVGGATGAGARAASPVSLVRAPPLARQPAPETFAAQLKRGLAAVLRQNGGSVTVRMAPASLGQIRIRLDLNQGQVSARFDVGGREAHRLLESDLDVLRETLEARGLRVEDLHVTIRPELAGPKDPPAHPGGQPASDSPDQQDAPPGGAGHREPGAGAQRDAPAPWQEADDEPGHEPPTMDPWASWSGGAAVDSQGPAVLRLRIDALA
jgi:flagellar hook-length control protein FliK